MNKNGRIIGRHADMMRYAAELDDGSFAVFDLEFGEAVRGDLITGNFDALEVALLRNRTRHKDIEVDLIEINASAASALAYLRRKDGKPDESADRASVV